MSQEILKLEKVKKSFGGVHAVKDMDITVGKGELTAIIGPNGAGKTTLFNLITGVYGVSSGSIAFCGESILKLRSDQIVKKGIARTFQNLRLFPDASVLENVMAAMQQQQRYSFLEAVSHLGRWKSKEGATRKKSMELLERVGLVDRYKQDAGTLPYGLQRRLEMARAIALEPQLLLLDEPAAGMNAEEIDNLNHLILKLHADFDLSIILIEHHMELVMKICPRIICVNFGAKITEGTPREIQNNKDVLVAYLGEDD